MLPFHGRRTQGQAEMRRDMGMGMGWGGACVTVPWKENTRTSRDEKRYGDGDRDGVGHVLPFHGRRTQGQAEMRRDMGMGIGMGWGGACVTVPWKENTRTSRDEKRYGEGDGVGWGMCYRSMEGEHKDKQR